eukprot:UN12360
MLYQLPTESSILYYLIWYEILIFDLFVLQLILHWPDPMVQILSNLNLSLLFYTYYDDVLLIYTLFPAFYARHDFYCCKTINANATFMPCFPDAFWIAPDYEYVPRELD